MKLLKKLLPFATIAAVAAVASPIVASCSKGTPDEVDLSQKYTPSIGKHELKDYTLETGLTEYFTQAKANPDIIRQDVYWSRTNGDRTGITGKTGLKNVSVNADKKTCSFVFTEKLKGGTDDYTMEVTATDVPFYATFTPTANGVKGAWTFGVVQYSSWTETSSKAVVKVNGTILGYTADNINETIDKTFDPGQDPKKLIAVGVLAYISWNSYYFSDCTGPEAQ